ncbi:MAG: AAA family ATPase [Phycisphaerales bacterium]
MPDTPDDDQTAADRDQAELDRLVRSGTPCLRVVTGDEAHVQDLLVNSAMGAHAELIRWTAVRGLRVGLGSDAVGVDDTEGLLEAMWAVLKIARKAIEPLIVVLFDAGPHLEDARTRRMLRELVDDLDMRHGDRPGGTVVVVGPDDQVPTELEPVTRSFSPSIPDTEELERIVRRTVKMASRERRIEAKLSRRDLAVLVRNLRGLGRREASQLIREAIEDDRRLDTDDLPRVLAWKREQLHRGGALEFIEAPVSLDDVAGLRRMKSWLAARREAFDRREPDPFLPPPRGMLLLGVQGAGKSLSAKAIATAWSVPLLRLDPGALYDRYVGESERRLRECLDQAEAMAPIVLWIDEIEKGFASAASRSTDGGLSQRMFGTLLTWMQDHRAPVFLVATANDIEALPPELLRKGRFDEIFFVDLPSAEVRQAILEIHLRRRGLEVGDFDLQRIADAADGFSGAEIEQAVIGAVHASRSQRRSPGDEDLLAVVAESPPLSVTMRERINALRAWAEGRCVPADGD